MNTLISFSRSTLFYAFYVVVIVLFGTFISIFGIIIPIKKRQNIATFANVIIIKWLQISCGVKFKVYGIENIPNKPCVILSKHQSGWETFYLQRLLRPASTILKKELFWIPFFGWALYFMRPIAIDRSNPKEALQQILSQGLKRLSNGQNVLIYPEGTRVEPGEIGRYGRSGAALAIAADVPILPISHNAGRCWPKHSFLKRSGTIHVVIGNIIQTKNMKSKNLTEHVKNVIETSQKKIKNLN
ncbi:MAG: 1-acyl-sn-glycerol-3-phosphate acyltransferase [Porticoccus sp.]|jgi:1-acyl-sn-glycerol-3-phosphate acyltransferase|nr:1-acyl-sn-glycerol-3-phosphate acyltransferase [Porticoccus sp.]|tara:strand:- start:197 stop:925 length:729 start_codon:yes stop_codon:yes gene_type:complete